MVTFFYHLAGLESFGFGCGCCLLVKVSLCLFLRNYRRSISLFKLSLLVLEVSDILLLLMKNIAVLLIDDVAFLLVNYWLVDLANLLLINDRLVHLVDDWLVVLMNDVLLILIDDVLVVPVDDILVLFVHNRLSVLIMHNRSILMSIDYCGTSMFPNLGTLLVLDHHRFVNFLMKLSLFGKSSRLISTDSFLMSCLDPCGCRGCSANTGLGGFAASLAGVKCVGWLHLEFFGTLL